MHTARKIAPALAMACALGFAPAQLAAAPGAGSHPPPHRPAGGGHRPGSQARPYVHYVRPAGPLPFLPSIARVRVAIGAEDVVVTHDVHLPRGDYHSGNMRFFVAFGAPGMPRALEASLLPVADGALEPETHATPVALEYERAARAQASDHTLLGSEQMAGVVIKVPEGAFRAATEPGLMATLRIRAQYVKPPQEERGVRSLVIRLGSAKDQGPLTLLRVDVSAPKALAEAEAVLCGADGNGQSLSMVATPALQAAPAQMRIAPVLAVRNARDNLCVHWLESP